MDNCFLTSDGGVEGDPTVLVIHDDQSQALWALAVKSKGSAPEVAMWVTQTLEEAGYRGAPIAIKTDQEESIMALNRAVALRRGQGCHGRVQSLSFKEQSGHRASHQEMARTV